MYSTHIDLLFIVLTLSGAAHADKSVASDLTASLDLSASTFNSPYHWLNTLFCVLKNVVFNVSQRWVFPIGFSLADGPRQMANNNLWLIAIAGPSRMLVTGVPLAYQGG
jgi:hypothetical protein